MGKGKLKNISLFSEFPIYIFVIYAYNNGINKGKEERMNTEISETAIKNIKDYIIANDISLTKLAKASGISYHKLWIILNQNYTIKLSDYIAICKALNEPFEYFIKEKVTS